MDTKIARGKGLSFPLPHHLSAQCVWHTRQMIPECVHCVQIYTIYVGLHVMHLYTVNKTKILLKNSTKQIHIDLM